MRIIKYMQTVKSFEEAEKFFAGNEGAEVICQNDSGLTKVVSDVEAANAFFEGEADAGSDTSEDSTGDQSEATGTTNGDQNQLNAGEGEDRG